MESSTVPLLSPEQVLHGRQRSAQSVMTCSKTHSPGRMWHLNLREDTAPLRNGAPSPVLHVCLYPSSNQPSSEDPWWFFAYHFSEGDLSRSSSRSRAKRHFLVWCGWGSKFLGCINRNKFSDIKNVYRSDFTLVVVSDRKYRIKVS